jgi:poly(beta-D-mannuronate) lyase
MTWSRIAVVFGLVWAAVPPAAAQYVEVTPTGSAVTASTNDGNVPGNAVDNNLSTRWSANGDGHWLQLDLATARTIGYVRVAVFSGNTRRNRFDLQVSNGGGTWSTVWAGESSGTTSAEETYDFTDVSARWVRYLGHGNSTNAWNSVAEVSVFAASAAPTPTPSPTPTSVPTVGPTPTPTPTPTPGGGGILVSSISELQSRINSATAGQRIVLRNGTYSTSGAVSISGRNGTSSSRIVIAAESVGGVTIGGSAGFSFSSSSYVTIEGFRFTHGSTQVVPANSHHIRLTRNVFQLGSGATHWVDISGDDVEVDHNVWQNKSTLGVYLAIHGPTSTTMCQRVWIHHNYFRDHSFSGANGGEPIRLGVSGRALSTSNATVEYNLFERTNGDPEAISLKSSGNTVRYNTIRDSDGCIVFRHGNASTVHGNFILNSACGMRVYGNDHKIYNNMMVNIGGVAVTVGSGTVQDHYSGEPSDSRTGNDASERVRLTFNTIVNASSRAIGGEDRTYAPRSWTIANNIFQSNAGTHVSFGADAPVGFTWQGNILWGSASNGSASGYVNVNPLLSADSASVYHIGSSSPAIDASAGTHSEVTGDVDGHGRSGIKDVGADEHSTSSPLRRPLNPADVGPNAP